MILVDCIVSNDIAFNEPELIEPFVKQLQATLNRYCLSLTGSLWEAEDLAQDTWLKTITKLREFQHPNTEALLLRAAKNIWIDNIRRNQLWAVIMQQQSPRASWPEYGTLGIEDAFAALMKHVSPLQRTVFLLRDVCGYSSSEAATMLGTTEGAVKAALHRARLALGAVRKEIEEGRASHIEDEGLKAFLRTLAVAYQMGDITTLVELAQRNEVEPAVAISIVQTRMLRKSHNVRSKTMQAPAPYQLSVQARSQMPMQAHYCLQRAA
ncbi:RNA polymerase sigma factor [Paenibacillus agricola]|uniref:RNA polymerase sigma factor n=1 Tax=Paenibacillus agricola TaxID=2716264 RepID=A0ABX0JKA8_9BACL|nr:RNA polymerase sigma factor [Paenibacillus agricola]NHN34451.1 RNA polymerase sigma factor [Paenibacillus agricola]